MWQDAELAVWIDMWKNEILTRGIWLSNDMVPCGPGVGCHVTPCLWCLKFMDSMGIEHWTSPKVEHLRIAWATTSRHVSAYYIYVLIVI